MGQFWGICPKNSALFGVGNTGLLRIVMSIHERSGWPFSLLNDEQMSNKVRVEHQPGIQQYNITSIDKVEKVSQNPDFNLGFHSCESVNLYYFPTVVLESAVVVEHFLGLFLKTWFPLGFQTPNVRRYLDPKNIPKAPNLRRSDWKTRVDTEMSRKWWDEHKVPMDWKQMRLQGVFELSPGFRVVFNSLYWAGVIKWDPFWGDQNDSQMYGSILVDFPQK